MQRAFSFQAHDDDPEYGPLPLPHDDFDPSPPQPPLHSTPPRPLRSAFEPTQHYDHTRHASTASTDSTVSSLSSVARGGLGAPSPRSRNAIDEMYNPQHPVRPRASLPRRPTATAAGLGVNYPPDNYDTYRHDSPRTFHSDSPISQSQLPLIATPGSRFADPLPSPPSVPSHRIDTLDTRSADRVLNDPVGGHYTDNPYSRYSTTWDPQLSARQVQVDGSDAFVFSDDEDDGARKRVGEVAPAAATGVERGGLLGGSEGGSTMVLNEKAMQSDWMQKQTHSKKKTRWVVIVILVVILLAAAGGTAAGVLLSKKKSGTSAAAQGNSGGSITSGGGGGLTESQDIEKNGELNKDSAEIKALLNNPQLHKVFHGIDYTPMNSQYPACLANPPTQNNVTRDVAVMSLLTDQLRLYGTDCNQTEMVLSAITALDIPMKIWLGVWLDYNTTTNARQLNHLYTLLSQYPSDRFEGVAVGNEVLFREDLSEQQLFSIIADVRANLTALKIDLPVGTSDLGSNWKSTMVPYVDVLMANVHPFFAGVVAEKAANWTWDFFEDNDVVLTQGLLKPPRVMISEVGWPSAGGNDSGSVAGIPEMNRFMEDFVCQENAKGTEYFWFSAFDEPWKVIYNTLGKQWEDKWGLMDVDRNLKDGLVIPSCK